MKVPMSDGARPALRIPLLAATLGVALNALPQEPADSLDFETDIDEIVNKQKIDSRRKISDSAIQS